MRGSWRAGTAGAGALNGPAEAADSKPAFLITIDTEGDNLWDRPKLVTTRNAEFLERFQQLCEQYELRPTWLTDHEMISSVVFRRFAADAVLRGGRR